MSGFTQINVGATANDGTGDSLRVSQQAVNTNFTATPRVLDLTSDLASEIAASSYARVVSNIAEGGIFKAVNSGTPDNINIFASATVGWTWQRIQSSKDRLSIADFNVLPSNSAATNDTNIALAITAAKTLKKPLYAPAGTYNFSAAIDATSDVNDSFAGIIGDGKEKTKFVQQTNNTALLRIEGRYFKIAGLTLKYETQQTTAHTNSNLIQCEDWVYFCEFNDLLLQNYYRGLMNKGVDLAEEIIAFFSNTCSNIRFQNGVYRPIELSGGTPNTWRNIYISNIETQRIKNAIYRAGAVGDNWVNINVEHSNITDSVIYGPNTSMEINSLHMEGVRLFASGGGNNMSFVRSNTSGHVKINGCTIDKVYLGPNKISSITFSGTTATLTVDVLDSQQQTHGFEVGDNITVTGFTDANYNGAFTVVSVPSDNTLTYTMLGTPAANAVVDFSLYEYGTVLLGSGAPVCSIVKAESPCQNVSFDGLRLRDVIVTGESASVRQTLFRVANEGSAGATSASVKMNNLSIQGEVSNAQLLDDLDISGFEVVSNVLTVYTKYKHGFQAGTSIVIRGTADPDYLIARDVLAVLSDHAFTLNLTKSDTGLVAGDGSITLATLDNTDRERASNIATITTSTAHGLTVGMRVRTRFGVTGYDKDDAAVLSVPTSTTFTYYSSGTDEATTAETGPIMLLDAGLSLVAFSSPSASKIIKEIPYFLEGCSSLDFGAITAGTPQTVSVTFEGVFAGDMVQFTELNAWENGVIVDARISASDTIMFRAQNLTGSPINPAVNVVFFKVTRN